MKEREIKIKMQMVEKGQKKYEITTGLFSGREHLILGL
jgi:hypothetical protein